MELTQDRIEYLVDQAVAVRRMSQMYEQLAEAQHEQEWKRFAAIAEQHLEARQRQQREVFLAERRQWKRQHPGRSNPFLGIR